MSKTPKYYVKGNLSEKQIEADVASFMGWCSPPGMELPFRLLDVDEQQTGADKLFDRGSLIFIQFKKSTGLKPVSEVKPSVRKGRSPLESIREFRAKHELDDDLSLFFQLRAKAKTADELQHNVLLRYERPPYSRGIYVAPLLLDKTKYHSALHVSADRFLEFPFYSRLRHTVYARRWVSRLGTVPFLREHVSIPPHERVGDHNHYFAYSEAGTDISWHSPSVVKREPSRLSDFLVSRFSQAIDNPDSMTSLEALREHVRQVGSSIGFTNIERVSNEPPMEYLRQHANWLAEAHGIRQFLLLGNSEFLARMRE